MIHTADIFRERGAYINNIEQRKVEVDQRLKEIGIDGHLKVLIATNSLNCGGQEHQVLRLIPELKKLGLDVEHMYYSAPHILAEKYKERDIKSFFIDKNKLGKFRGWKRQISFIRSQNYHIVHAFGGTANVYVCGAAVLAKTKHILASSRNRVGPQGSVFVFLSSLLNLFIKAWIINSSTNAEGLEKLRFMKRKRLYVLPNALEFDDKDYSQPVEMEEELASWINGRILVASIGRICGVKNFDLFIDAAKLAHKKILNSCFVIVGGPDHSEEGKYFQSRLQRRIKDENLESFIKMTGLIDDITSFYPHIDIVVSTSRMEGCPNVVLEAMRAAKPIVMTNSCDTSNIIDQGKNGFVVPVDFVDELADRIIYLLSSEKTRLEFGSKSRQIVAKNFSTSEAAWLLANIYLSELYKSYCVNAEKV